MLCIQISKLNDADESVTTVLGRCLPYIVPNVILAKREVSIVICVHVVVVCIIMLCIIMCVVCMCVYLCCYSLGAHPTVTMGSSLSQRRG